MSTPNLPDLTPEERGYGQRRSAFDLGKALGAGSWLGGAWLALTTLTFALEPENVNVGTAQVLLATILVILGIRVQLLGPTVRTGGVVLAFSGVFALWMVIGQPGNSAWVWGCGLVGSGLGVLSAIGVLATAGAKRS